MLPSQPGSFQLLTGAVKTYTKTPESGRKREMGFCPDCATQLYATSPDSSPGPKVHYLRVGALAERAQLVPRRQVWTRSAHAWIGTIAALPSAEKA